MKDTSDPPMTALEFIEGIDSDTLESIRLSESDEIARRVLMHHFGDITNQ